MLKNLQDIRWQISGYAKTIAVYAEQTCHLQSHDLWIGIMWWVKCSLLEIGMTKDKRVMTDFYRQGMLLSFKLFQKAILLYASKNGTILLVSNVVVNLFKAKYDYTIVRSLYKGMCLIKPIMGLCAH